MFVRDAKHWEHNMIIEKHHFVNSSGNKVACYYYEDRYRYSVTTDKGIEYRELVVDPSGILETMPDTKTLEAFLEYDIIDRPYNEPQMTNKCIRCSSRLGSPRKEYNLAVLCARCFSCMSDTSNVGAGSTFYGINEDGSKGSVIKE